MVFDDLSLDKLDDEEGLLMKAFFTQSELSQAAGRAYIEQLKLRVEGSNEPDRTNQRWRSWPRCASGELFH
jgi:hypothetical protein